MLKFQNVLTFLSFMCKTRLCVHCVKCNFNSNMLHDLKYHVQRNLLLSGSQGSFWESRSQMRLKLFFLLFNDHKMALIQDVMHALESLNVHFDIVESTGKKTLDRFATFEPLAA